MDEDTRQQLAEQFGTLSRRKLGDMVEEGLLKLLQNGRLQPGDKLPSERELMTLFGVGRPAIREAMQSLQRRGLIEIRHGERPNVAKPSFDRTLSELSETMRHVLQHSENSMVHLKEARLLFETQMARIAATRRTEADLAAIALILERQSACLSGSPEFLDLDGLFHEAIARVSGNPVFRSLSRALFSWLSVFHSDQVRRPGLEGLTVSEHHAILDAIITGDPQLAETRMAEHLNRASTLYHADNTALRP